MKPNDIRILRAIAVIAAIVAAMFVGFALASGLHDGNTETAGDIAPMFPGALFVAWAVATLALGRRHRRT